jgi:hypothetical protein
MPFSKAISWTSRGMWRRSTNGVIGRLHGFRHGLGAGEFRHVERFRVHCPTFTGLKRRAGLMGQLSWHGASIVQDHCVGTMDG